MPPRIKSWNSFSTVLRGHERWRWTRQARCRAFSGERLCWLALDSYAVADLAMTLMPRGHKTSKRATHQPVKRF